MAIIRLIARSGWLVAGACLATLQAQSFDSACLSLKLRAGASFGEIAKSNDNKRVIGIGLGGSMPFGRGNLTADVSYDLFNGQRHDEMRQGGPIYDAKGSTVDGKGVPYVLSNRSSLDFRKQLFRGFSARAGYLQPITPTVAWQAGLSLDHYQTYYEVVQTLIPVSGTNEVGSDGMQFPGYRYYEGKAETMFYAKTFLGFYGGVVWNMTDVTRLEMNVRNVGFLKADYTPFTYSGKEGVYSTSTKRGFALEFAFGLKI